MALHFNDDKELDDDATIEALRARVAELEAVLGAIIVGAESAFKPHGAIICSIAHEPLTKALNGACTALKSSSDPRFLAGVRAETLEKAAHDYDGIPGQGPFVGRWLRERAGKEREGAGA